MSHRVAAHRHQAALALLCCFLASAGGSCKIEGTIAGDPVEGRFAGNTIEFVDSNGHVAARLTTERLIDNVLDFDPRCALYKMATVDGRPDGEVYMARLDGSVQKPLETGLKVHAARIHDDGHTVALATWEHQLYVYDLDTRSLDGPLQNHVLPAGIFFEPGGSYRLLVNTELGQEPSRVDAVIHDLATGELITLPTAGQAFLARWSEPGKIVYGTVDGAGQAYEMDVDSTAVTEVAAARHQEAIAASRRTRAGLPASDVESGIGSTAQGLTGIDLALPYAAGVGRNIWQGYYDDPGNGLTTHSGLNRYAIDFGTSCASGGGYGSAILSTSNGVVSNVSGSNENGCSDPVQCIGCSGAGLRVDITHLGGYVSSYFHASAAYVTDGDDGCQGRHISDMGNSGYACGSCQPHPGTHLHFRILDGSGTPVVPEPLSGYTDIRAGQTLVSDNAQVETCDGSPPVLAGCYSNTLGAQVAHGDCVQVEYDACGVAGCGYYQCSNGSWVCSQGGSCPGAVYEHAACGGSPQSGCFSNTLGANVAHGDCVQVNYNACGVDSCSFYGCDNGSWNCTQRESCAGAVIEHGACQSIDCRSYDGDLGGCDAHAAQCAYYLCAEQCHPRGTAIETVCPGDCRDHDGDLVGCNNSALGCAYYACAEQCHPNGTPIENVCAETCRDYDGDLVGCNNSAANCAYYSCAEECHPFGTPLEDVCGPPPCPCMAGVDNYCLYGVDVPDCPMTAPFGYCDPNGDGSFDDADWVLGWYEYAENCS